MADADSPQSPLETAAEMAGASVVEAFELLSNETRLAILLALWEAKNPGTSIADLSEPNLAFSELRDRVGTRDSGQFNYHLDKLVGTFLRQREAGYELTESAEQILRAVISGALTDHASFEGEPIDTNCYLCGAPRVIDYDDGILVKRCTSCEGSFRAPDHPRRGVVATEYRPPAGLLGRTPQEFYNHGRTWTRHRMYSMMEEVCPDCSGSVTTTVHVCEDHGPEEDLCERCGSSWGTLAMYVCDGCKFTLVTPAFTPILTETSVKMFFYEHGLDIDANYDAGDSRDFFDAVEGVTVTSEDGLEIRVRVELENQRLTVTLDDETTVIATKRETITAD